LTPHENGNTINLAKAWNRTRELERPWYRVMERRPTGLKNYPQLIQEWHPEKNGELRPEDVTYGSKKIVWWKGTCGHEWKTAVKYRTTKGAGCPVCAKTWATPEINLRTRYPDIASEWHSEKNGNLTPEDVTHGSKKKVWWNGTCGHEWQATVSNRTAGRGCPYCAGKRGILNHKVSDYPTLVREWHPEKNGDLGPENVTRGSKKKIWWKCQHGHEWQAEATHRIHSGNGCPYCAGKRPSPEHSLANYPALVREWHPTKNGDLTPNDATPGSSKKVWWKGKCGHEWMTAVKSRTGKGTGCPICFKKRVTPEANLRVLCPDIAREWHPKKNGDLTPDDVMRASRKLVWWKGECGHEWQATVYNRSKGTGCPYCAGKRPCPENNLANYPALAHEWHPNRNGTLTPEHVTPGSRKEVWWKGKCGHEWKAAVRRRTAYGTGCPICAKRRATSADNLRTTRPDIAAQWHPGMNGDLRPEHVTPVSRNQVWWLCKRGHAWQAEVLSRTYSGAGCPHCTRQKDRTKNKLSDYPELVKNSVRDLYPEIAREWHPEKNGDLTPKDVTYGSKKKVWWKGECGHEWKTAVKSRTTKGTGCPVCAKMWATPERNLRTRYPDIASEWHPNKNGDLKPEHVAPLSGKKVWWKGRCGHEWEALVHSRTTGRGCPICAGKRTGPDVNLRVQYPEIAKEWHPEKNGPLSPEDVTTGSGKKVWWMCEKGHEWQAMVNNRRKGSGCPICAGKLPAADRNLRVLYPNVAQEWHTVKNGNLAPEHVTPGSTRKVWWMCENGHEWQAIVNHRRNGSRCPVCAGRRPGPDHNLRDQFPDIAQEWHPERNGNLTPEDVTPGSSKKVWWLCENGHEWETMVKNRTSNGTGCPQCARKRSRSNHDLLHNPPLVRE